MSDGIVLRAIDGSNPLGFLAALGAFRLLDLNQRNAGLRMKWKWDRAWRPELTGIDESETELSQRLLDAKTAPVKKFSEGLGKNITVEPEKFRGFVMRASHEAKEGDRTLADFAAAFGCEACEDKDKGRIEYTDLCFITGSGHQNFLETMESLASCVTADHIRDALFGPWRANKRLSMRWDPCDAAEYALRWGDPSQEGASSVWGANLLAVEALPLFPTLPTKRGLQTTGFVRERRQWPRFTWPIWTQEASLDTIRSLLSLAELQAADDKIEHKELLARGIEEVYRAPRVRIGQGANFKVSFRPAKAV